MKKNLLGIKIDSLTQEEAKEKIRHFLQEPKNHLIFTPNPEMIVLAQKDTKFKYILNQADLSLPDGVGLILLSPFLGQSIRQRIPGVDFLKEICQIAEQMNKKVYLIGGEYGIAKKAAEKLKFLFPKLQIVGAEEGPSIQEKGEEIVYDKLENQKLIQRINQSKAQIIFVAFGQNKQEKWIYENIKMLPGVTLAMGVGGAFDFLAQKVPRAPVFWRKIGFEWLWRLIQEPKRYKRIFNAVIVFPYLVIVSLIKNKLLVKKVK